MTNPQDPYAPGQYGSQQQGWSAPQHSGSGQPSQGWSAPQPPAQPPAQPQQGWQQQPGWQPPQQEWQQQPAPQYGQYGQPQQGWQTPAPLTPPAPKGHGKAIAVAAAAVVLIGGGAATYVAMSSSDSAAGGSKTPKAAVQKIMADLQNSDVLGTLDDLPPGERSALSAPFKAQVAQLKRNDILRSDANLNKLSGFTFSTSGLTYDASTVQINDHVQIVKLTGGKITVGGNTAQLPVTADFLKYLTKSGQVHSGTQTVDIADVVQRTHKPIRLATQKVDGKWYPSLFYTIADNATTSAGKAAPTAADAIPAVGASSADDAVRSMITALLAGDKERAIELLSPDELQVMHDYGKMINGLNRSQVTLKNITFNDTPVSGGTKVSLKSIALENDGQTISLSINGSCIKATVGGSSRSACGADLLNSNLLGQTGGASSLTAAQRTAIGHLFNGISKIGVVATQSGGKWYVNPVRSFNEVSSTLLSGLQSGDMKALLELADR